MIKSEVLSDRELRIFSHQIGLHSIGIEGQEKIKKTKVIVAGAGGKGSFVIQNLAFAGIGHLGISDNRIIEETTLSKQCLYGENDLGKQRAIVCKHKLLEKNNNIKIEVHNILLNENNIIPIISGYDIIVDATDNADTHQLIAKISQQYRKPVVLGSTKSSFIHITVLNYKGNFSIDTINNTNFKIIIDDSISELGIPEIIVNNLAGCLMANETLKIILDLPDILTGKLLEFDVQRYKMNIIGLTNTTK
jgi:adenylyltransferase/sulfurtransferase